MQSKDVRVGGEYAASVHGGAYATTWHVRVTGPKQPGVSVRYGHSISDGAGFPVEVLGKWNESEGVVQACDSPKHYGDWKKSAAGVLLVPARLLSAEWSVAVSDLQSARAAKIAIMQATAAADQAFAQAASRLSVLASGIGRPDVNRRMVMLDTAAINALADLLEGGGR